MSTIIELIITFVLYFLICLAAALPLAIFHTRKMDKLISNYFRKIDESRAARLQNLKEVHAQVDELNKSAGEIDEDIDEMHQSINEIDEDIDEMHESIGEIGKSLDRMNESMDRTIEFKRLMRDYSNYKIKMIEARENFHEPEFSDEKNIH